MTGQAGLGLRMRWVGLLALVLLVASVPGAAAHWTAQTSMDGTAAAATVGLDQELLPAAGDADAAATYSTESPTLSRAVSITNTGSREARYTLAVHAAPATQSGLPQALLVAAARVDTGQDCTPQRSLGSATTSPLAGGLEVSGTLSAGATVILCVQTSLDTAALRSFAGAEIELQLSTVLTYAEADRWTLDGDEPMTVSQRVAADPIAELELGTFAGDQPWYLEMRFSPNEGHQDTTSYRVYLAHEGTPDQRVLYGVPPNGWDTVVRFQHGSPEIREFTESTSGGLGNAWVYVEQQVAGDEHWTPVAVGKLNFMQLSNSVGIQQGWT